MRAATAQEALGEALAAIHEACKADTRTRWRPAAFHEAAHAVISTLEGIEVGLVSLDPAEVRTRPIPGWVPISEDEPHHYVPSDVNDPRQRAYIAPKVRSALAGPLVSAVCFGEIDHECDDGEKAALLVAQVYPEHHGIDANQHAEWYLDRLRGQTSRMLTEHWPAVQAVAERLLERGQVTGSEVRRIVRRTTPSRRGDRPPSPHRNVYR